MDLALPFSGLLLYELVNIARIDDVNTCIHVFNLLPLSRLLKTDNALDTDLKRALSDQGPQVPNEPSKRDVVTGSRVGLAICFEHLAERNKLERKACQNKIWSLF